MNEKKTVTVIVNRVVLELPLTNYVMPNMLEVGSCDPYVELQDKAGKRTYVTPLSAINMLAMGASWWWYESQLYEGSPKHEETCSIAQRWQTLFNVLMGKYEDGGFKDDVFEIEEVTS